MFLRTESFKEFIRFYPVVTGIITIHIVLYLVTILPFFPNYWVENLVGVNILIAQGEVWRLVTPVFVHAGFAHMLFNSFSLVLFGPALERILGKWRFIAIYLATGIVANIATFFLKPLIYVHVGSSGAIFGLFGVYVAMIVFRRELMSRQNSQIVLTIAVIGLIMTFIQPNINVTAHLFGFLGGFVLGSVILGRGKDLTQSIRTISSRAAKSASNRRLTPQGIILMIIVILALIGLLSR